VGGRGPCPEGFTAHHADATNFRRKAEPGGPPAASDAMTDLPLAGVTCYQVDIEAQWRPDTGVPRRSPPPCQEAHQLKFQDSSVSSSVSKIECRIQNPCCFAYDAEDNVANFPILPRLTFKAKPVHPKT
jgi:hypothetical protein